LPVISPARLIRAKDKTGELVMVAGFALLRAKRAFLAAQVFLEALREREVL
jgi:hypothetical protein